jgi:hypothetical protein
MPLLRWEVHDQAVHLPHLARRFRPCLRWKRATCAARQTFWSVTSSMYSELMPVVQLAVLGTTIGWKWAKGLADVEVVGYEPHHVPP